uniref:Suf domain-containing protein n=1 Tax=Macrostomum lignano TaxID=282301 RepID=A0A1I8F7W4_9PLAT
GSTAESQEITAVRKIYQKPSSTPIGESSTRCGATTAASRPALNAALAKKFIETEPMAAKQFADEAASMYDRATQVLKENTLLYFAYADYEEGRGNFEKVHSIYRKLVNVDRHRPDAAVHSVHEVRPPQGGHQVGPQRVQAGRADRTAPTTYSPRPLSWSTSAARTRALGQRIFDLGMKRFGQVPEYVLCYTEYMSHLNEDTTTPGARALTSGSVPTEKSRVIWAKFLEFETSVGDLASVLKAFQGVEVFRGKETALPLTGSLYCNLVGCKRLLCPATKFMELFPCSEQELRSLGYTDLAKLSWPAYPTRPSAAWPRPLASIDAPSGCSSRVTSRQTARRWCSARPAYAKPDFSQMLPFREGAPADGLAPGAWRRVPAAAGRLPPGAHPAAAYLLRGPFCQRGPADGADAQLPVPEDYVRRQYSAEDRQIDQGTAFSIEVATSGLPSGLKRRNLFPPDAHLSFMLPPPPPTADPAIRPSCRPTPRPPAAGAALAEPCGDLQAPAAEANQNLTLRPDWAAFCCHLFLLVLRQCGSDRLESLRSAQSCSEAARTSGTAGSRGIAEAGDDVDKLIKALNGTSQRSSNLPSPAYQFASWIQQTEEPPGGLLIRDQLISGWQLEQLKRRKLLAMDNAGPGPGGPGGPLAMEAARRRPGRHGDQRQPTVQRHVEARVQAMRLRDASNQLNQSLLRFFLKTRARTFALDNVLMLLRDVTRYRVSRKRPVVIAPRQSSCRVSAEAALYSAQSRFELSAFRHSQSCLEAASNQRHKRGSRRLVLKKGGDDLHRVAGNVDPLVRHVRFHQACGVGASEQLLLKVASLPDLYTVLRPNLPGNKAAAAQPGSLALTLPSTFHRQRNLIEHPFSFEQLAAHVASDADEAAAHPMVEASGDGAWVCGAETTAEGEIGEAAAAARTAWLCRFIAAAEFAGADFTVSDRLAARCEMIAMSFSS